MKGYNLRLHIYSVVAITLFSTIEVVGKLIGSNISPYAITAWRFFIGGFILLPFAVKEIQARSESLTIKAFFQFAIAGILVVCISMLFLQLSVFYGKAALSAVIVSSNPLFVTIFAIFILKEKISSLHIIGLFAGIIGLALIIFGEWEIIMNSKNLEFGIIFGLGAALTFAIYTVYSKGIIKHFGGISTISIAFIIGAISLFIFSLFKGEDIFFNPNIRNLTAIAYLSIFVTGIAYILYFKAITQLGAAKASLYFFLKPAIATFLSWMFLKETLNSIQVIGILLIMISLSRETIMRLFSWIFVPQKVL